MTLDQVISEIFSFLSLQPQAHYKLVIGSDSHERVINDEKVSNFVTAIVIHCVGTGGRYYWKNGTKRKTHSLRDKVYQETTLSLDLATELRPLLTQRQTQIDNLELEIHIDVGNNGPTIDMINEVVGMVTGYGFTAKTKPSSYGASTIADKYT